MGRVSLEKEKRILELYDKGYSMSIVAREIGCGKSTIARTLKRHNIKSRTSSEGKKILFERGLLKIWNKGKECPQLAENNNPFYGKKHSEDTLRKISDKIKQQYKQGRITWCKGKTKEVDERILKISLALKGKPKSEEHKKKLSEFRKGKTWEEIMGDELAKITKKKKSEWVKKNQKILLEGFKRFLKENPDFLSKIAKRTHKRYPNLASRMGKSTHKKYPNLASERLKETIKKWKERDSASYYLACAKGMATVKMPSIPEKRMRALLPREFIFQKLFRYEDRYSVPDFRDPKRRIVIQVDGPTHYKTMGKFYNIDRLRKTQQKDKMQEKWWKEMGYKVYRFKDVDIIKKPEEVKSRLKNILSKK